MISVRFVRGDGRTFSMDGVLLGLVAASGLDAPNVEVFTQKAAAGDGDLITAQRVGSRVLEFTAKARKAVLNDPLRRSITAFFSPAQSFQVYIHRADGVRFADGCRLESLQIPTENIHTPLTVTLSLLMPEGYFLSADGFGKNIAAIEPRCGYPYAAQAGVGRIYGLYAFAQTVYLDNDGDAQAYLKAVFSARGTVTNPKLMAGGGFVRMLMTLQAGDVLVVDGKTRAVTLNGDNASARLDRHSSFEGIVFGLGSNTVSYTADAGANLLDVYVYYNKRYIGA